MTSWQPTANFDTLKQRAELLDRIRAFFKLRDVLEVETPLLSHYTVTDRHIESFSVNNSYLQTSPEYAMKRLLAAGSGPIFQISKAFRQEESGRQHNPEFTLLEWYRPDFTQHDLMDEMATLLTEVANLKPAKRFTYQTVFERYCRINPLTCEDQAIKTQLYTIETESLDRDTCLQLLFSEKIEPHLGVNEPTFVYDFPVSQAALAKIRQDDPPVAERFEVFIQGKEIANGFYELTDAEEQQQRFEADQYYRQQHHKKIPEIDPRFIAALQSGMPDCAGVALGIDRLLLCLTKKNHIKKVIAFDSQSA